MPSLRLLLAAVLTVALVPRGAAALSIVDPGQGPVALVDTAATGPSELSGVTWVPGTSEWLAVSDGQSLLHRLSVPIDPVTGEITSATTLGAQPLVQADGTPFPSARDFEGVALGPGGASVFVSDEIGPRLREFSLATGRCNHRDRARERPGAGDLREPTRESRLGVADACARHGRARGRPTKRRSASTDRPARARRARACGCRRSGRISSRSRSGATP